MEESQVNTKVLIAISPYNVSGLITVARGTVSLTVCCQPIVEKRPLREPFRKDFLISREGGQDLEGSFEVCGDEFLANLTLRQNGVVVGIITVSNDGESVAETADTLLSQTRTMP